MLNINWHHCQCSKLNALIMMYCAHFLLNKYHQSTAICRQIIRVDIEKKYFSHYLSLPDIRICFSGNAMLEIKYGIGMEV